jgi:hypothetical protein
MSNYIGQFGRKFDDLQDFKKYIKSLTPSQVEAEWKWLGKQYLTEEVQSMFNLCQSALVHIETNWSDTFQY